MMSTEIVLEENKTSTLIKNLGDYYSDIESSLKNMSDLILDMSLYLDGDIYDSAMKKLSEFESQFGIINDNLKSYIVDFKSLLYSFKQKDSDISLEAVEQSSVIGGEIVNVKI